MCAPSLPTPTPTSPSAYVYSTGSAFGNHYTTEQVIHALKRNANKDFDIDFAARVLLKCGFDFHSFALPLEDIFRRFTREEYLQLRKKQLVNLAEQAGRKALAGWCGGVHEKITHLFWGTMTGALDSPTIDIQLVKNLGLDMDVERTNIEGMGCLTGYRLLNLARQVCLGDPDARILVISADLRSALGNSMPSNPTKSDIVSTCLFRDGASAAVVGGHPSSQDTSPCYEIVTGASRIVEGTSHLVDYHETNDGAICLHLDKQLPEHIGLAEPDFVATLLRKGRKALHNKKSQQGDGSTLPTNVKDMDILCHTGGPKVLREVAASLGVTADQNMHSSWEVMKNNGNLSGASNLCVLDHHNSLSAMNMKLNPTQLPKEWAVCLSMGPGVCLEGILLRDVRCKFSCLPLFRTVEDISSPTIDNVVVVSDASNTILDTRKVVHIVGGGIAGLTLASALDPKIYNVQVFEAASHIREQGYGIAVWPNTMKILREKLGIAGLDLRKTKSMAINRKCLDQKLEIKPPNEIQDKGFMKRSSLLGCLLNKVLQRHPGCISTDHKCLRVRFGPGEVTATYESNGSIITHTCDLLVGADGVNSVVRKYVSLKVDSRVYGHMTAYRFIVPSPSDELLKQTEHTWNMSISDSVHSPCYHISNDDNCLNVVVLDYDGMAPSQPRQASSEELRDVAQRSNMSFITNLLNTETIKDLMCYSTFHVDSEPWHQPNAVIIGDAAHAYGPLTAKMANLAINDADTLASILNLQKSSNLTQRLQEWEHVQRPKFEVTRIRTLRHLQLYSPRIRFISSFFWRFLPTVALRYFGSIFAYDYELYDQISKAREPNMPPSCHGIVGIKNPDPLVALLKEWVQYFGLVLLVTFTALY